MRKPDPGRIAPLARLKVGTKLMLLVLLPVCVLLGFTGFTALADWHAASQLQDFRAATRLSFATAGVAGQLATERTAAAMVRLRPGAQAQAGLGAAQRDVNQALHHAQDSAADWHGSVDVAGRLALARKQLAALRLRAAGGSLSVPDISTSYGTRVNDLIGTVGDLIEDQPPQSSGQTPDAYLAMLQAIEAAQRERVDVAAVLGVPRDQTALDQMTATSRWATLEGAELGTFRQNAPGRLAADLDAVLRTPAGIAVRTVRDDILARPRAAVAHTSLGAWLDATGTRIGGLGRLESGTGRDLATTASRDLHAARAGGLRNLGLLLAVLSVVTALGLVLRRSITQPLSEVSEGARTLSSGDLAFDVSYAGRDEIGDVAAAFRDLHVTAERLVGEIRATNAAISDNRLDHRADVGAFEGTWAQLLAGMNDTTAAFARARADLAASRARIVAASDQARRQIEHDLHDGAQQRLVSLGLGLRAAQKAVPPGQPGLRQELARLARGTAEILEELREISRGIHPAILSLGGLGLALKALARRSPVPVKLDVRVQARLPERAEVAAYFVVSEALANVAKHARASVVQVRVEVRAGVLTVSIRDDGIGGADPSRGSGLIGLTDRVEASGGTISISSHAGAGTRITAELPVDAG
ncbi:MAG TPA: nitrate- and nitrite sensing domain-containing protein [Streptosporangiaceae bacterium]|nr:nitrate- and nitrite sensing domain-containing protein [Streptosporangiaceae bacterium]